MVVVVMVVMVVVVVVVVVVFPLWYNTGVESVSLTYACTVAICQPPSRCIVCGKTFEEEKEEEGGGRREEGRKEGKREIVESGKKIVVNVVGKSNCISLSLSLSPAFSLSLSLSL